MESIRKLRKEEALPLELLLLADPSEQKVGEYCSEGDIYVAELDKKIVGVYVLYELSEETVELINIAVKESMQGKGIGKRLIEHSFSVAKSNGYNRIEVGTGNSSLDQLALYQKSGFRMERIIRDFFAEYEEPIVENGIICRDMVRLTKEL